MPPITTLLVPLLFLLPGWALLAGRRKIGFTDRFLLSLAATGWAAQTMALAGRFTLLQLTLAVSLPSLALLLVRGPRRALSGIVRPSTAKAIALFAALLLAALLYRPPGVTLLGDHPAPAFHGLGLHLARTGALPLPGCAAGLATAAQSMRAVAGPGLVFPALVGLLQLLGGSALSGAAPAILAALSLLAAFHLGRSATGNTWFGAVFLVALGLNYPQAWLARTAVPEATSQLLVLTAALFFVRAGREAHGEGPGTVAAAFCLGTALLCAPGLLLYTPPALLLLLALYGDAAVVDRRRAATFSLTVLPFMAQAWAQAVLLERTSNLLPPLHSLLPALALSAIALCFLHPPRIAGRRLSLTLLSRLVFAGVFTAWYAVFLTAVPRLPGGSSHWMVWYVTLPLLLLFAAGLLWLSSTPARMLGLVRGLGPLFPLALVGALRLFHHPGETVLQPWAVRPFTVALIPSVLLVALIFFRQVLLLLGHPLLRIIWCACLAVLLGLNLANQMPMATARPGQGAASLLDQAAEPLSGRTTGFTAVVEPGPASLGLHIALESGHGISAAALGGDPRDRERFHALVRQNSTAGRRTALVVEEGTFTPDPAKVRLVPLAGFQSEFRRQTPEPDHLPSSVTISTHRLLVFEALPAAHRPVDPVPASVDVGDYGQDWPLLVDGFHGISRTGGTSFRWTGGLARLRLPAWAHRAELTLGGFRPPGAADALVSARIVGHGDVATRCLPREGFTTLSIACPPATGDSTPILELRSTTFRPGFWFTGPDHRVLGIQLAAASFFADRAPTTRKPAEE